MKGEGRDRVGEGGGEGDQAPGRWNLSWRLAKRTLEPSWVCDEALVPLPGQTSLRARAPGGWRGHSG